jgi:dCMP deaminase
VISCDPGEQPVHKARPSWDDTCMSLLPALEARAICFTGLRVGGVLFDPQAKDILAVGYNGTPHGMPECTYENRFMDGTHHLNCLHMETNVGLKAGARSQGAYLYSSLTPCARCAILCVQMQIKRFIYKDIYANNEELDFARQTFRRANIDLIWHIPE